MLFRAQGQVRELREKAFATEKEMQRFCEENLNLLLGLIFVASEFPVAQFRLDTVAYDADSNAFVVIEYKNNQNFSVIDQGYSYISSMQSHRADFVLKYNQVFNVSKGIRDFDWSQVRVLFVAPRYTQYQMGSIQFKDLPMELWKINRYEGDIVQFEQIRPTSTAASITGFIPAQIGGGDANDTQRHDQPTPSSREIVVYQEEDRLQDGSDMTRELYQELKDYILSLDENIKIKPTKLYIGFLLRNHNLVDIKLQHSSVVVWLNRQFGDILDPQRLIRDVTHIGHHGNGDCELKIADRTHMGYIKDLLAEHYRLQNERNI